MQGLRMVCRLRLSPAFGLIVLAAALVMTPLSGPSFANGGGGEVALRPMVTGDAPVLPPPPMIVARMRATGPCGSRCPEWIMAQGGIMPDTPEQLRQQLRLMGQAKLPVVLESPGGDLDAALQMGRMIRAAGLTTIVGRSEPESCKPGDQACNRAKTAGLPQPAHVTTPAQCSGECLFMLAGGVRRAGSWITGAKLAALGSFRSRVAANDAAKRIAAYLADMGISAGLVVRLRKGGLELDGNAMQHFGLSTGRDRVEDFTGSSICMGSTPAPNCVTLTPPSQPAILAARLKPLPPPPARLTPKPVRKKPPAPRPARLIVWGAIGGM